MTDLSTSQADSKGRRRFSLRTLFFLILLCAVAAAAFSLHLKSLRTEAALVAKLDTKGLNAGWVPRKPQWLYKQFDKELANEAIVLHLTDSQVTDSDLEDIAQISGLRGLSLDRTEITNLGMEKLSGLSKLVQLSARHTSISECPSLARMHDLTALDLSFTSVSKIDTAGLDSLEKLQLRGTKIDDSTVESLSALPNLKILDISGALGGEPAITDKGVLSLTLEKFPQLSKLYIYDSDVSDDAIAELKVRFPWLTLTR